MNITLQANTMFNYHVTNEYGCTDVATETINISNLLQIFVPNSFTPNNDGNNDAWIPVVSGTS